MLGRRQLREKVMQAIYAYNSQGSDSDVRIIEKNMMKGIDQIYDLYLYLLNTILILKDIALEKIEIGKTKNFPTQEDLHPNMKFVENKVFHILSINNELNDYVSKNKQISWDIYDSYPNNIYKSLIKSDLYVDYMKSEIHSLDEDKAFITQFFVNFIADNEGLHDWFEEQHINWVDDIHIANTMVYNTIQSFTTKSGENIKLFKVYKDEEDQKFAQDLFRLTVKHQSQNKEFIGEMAENWELDRIAAVDLIILEMAITEFKHFPSIPTKVTINEYIELAKNYSTEKSRIFVNGILDKALRKLTDSNQVNKFGRGLFEK
ncbi:transcription antitermination factor NusB [Weeksella virosa]|uniref:transcription antitermination factor NusB n=1 Tax=Weeksella virosa TaxID=1014 RepID=UPI0025578B2F|nr:transcription antitermination factor NusB [Weeksella virosa]MDK7374467.1 transcription antitermination factor NusB [Weeksella virosa]